MWTFVCHHGSGSAGVFQQVRGVTSAVCSDLLLVRFSVILGGRDRKTFFFFMVFNLSDFCHLVLRVDCLPYSSFFFWPNSQRTLCKTTNI